MSDIIMDAYWRTPLIARTVTTAIIVVSIGAHSGIIPFGWLYFHYLEIFKFPPEIWRFVTSFLVTGPKFGIIMDTYFIFQYLSQLENSHPKFGRKEDLLWYLVFCGGVILVLAQFFGGFFYLAPLTLAIVYTAVQDARGQKTNFFFLTVPAQLIPVCMLVVTLLIGGPQAVLTQLSGIVAAHLHDFLTRIYPEFGGAPNLAPTPGFFSYLIVTPRVLQRQHGTAIRAPASSGSSTGVQGNGPLPDSWKTRGSGHRLG